MRTFLRDNGLTLVLMGAFLLSLAGMAVAGWQVENQELAFHGMPPQGLGDYVFGPDFTSAMFENWESEFLQMSAYVVLTAYLFQRGSSESRDPDKPGRDGDDLPAGLWPGRTVLRWLYAHSLGLALWALFLVSFVVHWLASAEVANLEAARHGRPPQTAWAYLADAELWFESLQNWQSEFLATAVLVALSIVLRYRGSPESKPVNAGNRQTGRG